MKNQVPEALKGFGERLRRLRRNANYTQAELSSMLGVVTSSVGKYESAADSYPSVEILVKLAEIFDVSTDYLLRGLSVAPVLENNGTLNANAFIQANSGDVSVDSNSVQSPEAEELLKIYKNLTGLKRLELLSYAFKLSQEQSGGLS